MTLLLIKIVALLAFLFGIIALIVQLVRKDSKNVIGFLVVGILGLALYVIGDISEHNKAETSEEPTSDVQTTVVAENNEANSADSDADLLAAIAEAQAEEDKGQAEAGEPEAQAPVENAAENPEAAKDGDVAPAGEVVAAADPEAAEPVAEEKPVENAPEEKKDEPAAPAEAPAATASGAPVITETPGAPIANAGKDMDDGKIKEEIVFDGSKSKKGKNKQSIKKYEWHFGDGTSAEGEKVKHSYDKVGDYVATLTLTDASGAQSQATRKISICRPESRIRNVESKVPDALNVKASPSHMTGKMEKAFACGKANIEAKANIVSTPGCTCGMTVKLSGACTGQQSKKIDNGGEGNIAVKASCTAGVGEIEWSFTRDKKGEGCECTWKSTELVVSET